MSDPQLEFERPKKFQRLVKELADHGIVELTDACPRLLDPAAFEQFGFGIFLAWIVLAARTVVSGVRFVRLTDDETLFLASPVGRGSYITPAREQDPPYFSDGILHFSDGGICPHALCRPRNQILFNLSSIGSGTSLTQDDLATLVHPSGDHSCGDHANDLLRWMVSRVRDDPEFGRAAGGYPALLRVAPSLFGKALAQLDEGSPEKGLGELFDAFLTIDVGVHLGADVCWANTTMIQPFLSYELDGVAWRRPNPLIILETTNWRGREQHERRVSNSTVGPDSLDGAPLQHLKQKLLAFQALDLVGIQPFRYIYISLIPELERLPGDQATLRFIADNSPNFAVVSLPEMHRDLPGRLREDWWNLNDLRAAFDHIRLRLREIVDPLAAGENPTNPDQTQAPLINESHDD